MKVIITSDQHLGYQNSDKASFKQFLDQLEDDPTVTDFVLLGDVVDMWRRDASGVYLENKDILESVTTLKQKMNIYYVTGNHDFHALELLNHTYPFNFQKNLTLTDGPFQYRFLHGWEFDPEQKEPLMEALCRVMSDDVGNFESGLWAQLTRDWSDMKYVLYSTLLFWRKQQIRRTGERLQLPPEQRLPNSIDEINSRACASVQPGEILVFGHTHQPFMNIAENVVNSGSWVTDALPHNTYVELSNGKPRLFVFQGQEITKRIQC